MYDSSYSNDPVYIRVIAPATLDEGYTFDVMVDDSPYTVNVPKGGVKEGQEFTIEYDTSKTYKNNRNDNNNNRYYSDDDDEYEEDEHHLNYNNKSHNNYTNRNLSSRRQKTNEYDNNNNNNDNDEDTYIQTGPSGDDYETKNNNNNYIDDDEAITIIVPIVGKWRTMLCSCCDVLTQATCWMGFCCTPILIAQLITRFQLTWNGQHGYPIEETSLSFNRIVLTMIIILSISNILPLIGTCIILPCFYLYVVVRIGSTVRKFIRTKYQIPPTNIFPNCISTKCSNYTSWCCSEHHCCTERTDNCRHRIDDCCCMFWCGCCSTIQMARHTHNDKEYPGHGCTTTGLEFTAPHIV